MKAPDFDTLVQKVTSYWYPSPRERLWRNVRTVATGMNILGLAFDRTFRERGGFMERHPLDKHFLSEEQRNVVEYGAMWKSIERRLEDPQDKQLANWTYQHFRIVYENLSDTP